MSDEEEGGEITFTCAECGEDRPEAGSVHKVWGERWCLDCIREEHPDHITTDDDSFKDEDIEFHAWPPRSVGGQHTGAMGVGVLALHRPTGLAATSVDVDRSMQKNRAAAVKLLRKAYNDISRLESNERYGAIME